MNTIIRKLIYQSILAITLLSAAFSVTASNIDVYKSPTCKCCAKWVDHLRTNGFIVNIKDIGNKEARKHAGISSALGSCHTAIVDGYAIEGHVPAQDIKRFINNPPSNAIGLAVPGMPMGSPGMEGSHSDPYNVLLIDKKGDASVYSRHIPSDQRESVLKLK